MVFLNVLRRAAGQTKHLLREPAFYWGNIGHQARDLRVPSVRQDPIRLEHGGVTVGLRKGVQGGIRDGTHDQVVTNT